LRKFRKINAVQNRKKAVFMPSEKIQISLVVATLGRTVQLDKLFESLVGQDYCDFEVIIVDQNTDNRLEHLSEGSWPFRVSRIHTPNARGLSRARNVGWKAAKGELIIFPDDDCWYPPWFLSRGIQLVAASQADVLTGRAADEAGHDINGRYSAVPHTINRSNVWTSGIEWVMLFKKTVLLAVNGFDEEVGVGASTPWQASEGQDILLRALDKGLTCYFDPAFFGHHLEFDRLAPKLMQAKGRAYGRGMGYVLRVHHYSCLTAAWWVGRPFAKLLLSILKGDFEECSYFFNISLGRLEGYVGRTLRSKV
jgi:glycosyltransferase involved in cell wall biosynthesis